MEERHLGKIYPGLDLCDVNGNKVGTIARVYREEAALMGQADARYDEIIEVKTGFLGFGKRLYVPLKDVDDVSGNAAFLTKTKGNLEPAWAAKPAHLDRLS